MTTPLPPGPFDLILADPGWHFTTRSDKGRGKCPKYRTESVEEICALPVKQIAARDSRLFLWVSNPHLHHGADVIRAWGFEPKSNWVWIKQGPPCTGWWARFAHEIVMIGARGNKVCPQDPGERPLSWFNAPKTRVNSQKPVELYERLEALWPGARKIELFARPPHRPGWAVWGDEVQPGL
jgi:N6-adenosine-specific RNA methylase IME4